ncbi:transglycosylase domain-containing protein [Citromicrobium bathyomarinum]|uniref:transglycosylase domain-containing protein n=1 Tax=Sphingomonadales TaxID=204457 RepID=UPI000C41E86C|nr:transglycosylase domain-containing protein [Citromicrobium sp.]MBO82140.1 penicillin-binding protein [Citromicrobium sp.]|tara:strand:+ start:31696 stop:33840 length:2145 start_codon:yes stop_codon:yes gene_type:complete
MWGHKAKPRLGHEAAGSSAGHSGYYSLADSMADDPWDDDDPDFAEDRRTGPTLWDLAYEILTAHGTRYWGVRIAAGLLLLVILTVIWLAFTAPLSKSLEPIAPPQVTLLAADGTPIARNGAVYDEPVDVDRLPDHVVQAFLATEDRRFYSHWGVDPRGLARATLNNISGGPTQGGSTITQQLAKFTFLTPEQSLSRKAREMLIAFWLESWLSKDDILERYLSNAYFGDNTYGLRAASLHYFYRQPERLEPNQAAMLAGLLKAPSAYAPSQHYERAAARMQAVKASLVSAGFLSEGEANRMRPPELDMRLSNDLPTGTYFADWALPEARDRTQPGYALQALTTTLDARLQGIARDVIADAPLGDAQAALVAMRRNGEVVAMIGGTDYSKSAFNRVTQARRQPGSTFKTIVYLAALQNGFGPEDPVSNRPFTQGSYRPENYDDQYSDFLTLEQAFARSSNVAAVRMFNEVGSAEVIELARDLGISSPIPRGDPSVALGTAGMSLMELTAAYAGIAGNSYPVRPTAFLREPRGLWDRIFNAPRSFSGSTHNDIERLLRTAINDGTGRAAQLPGLNFGKTGTTQNNRDALFVGYAGDLVVGVWVGNDDNTPLDGVSGGGLPARIWKSFMLRAQGIRSEGPARRRDPRAPVQPLDVPNASDIPDPVEEEGAEITTDSRGITIREEAPRDEAPPLDAPQDSPRSAPELAPVREEETAPAN